MSMTYEIFNRTEGNYSHLYFYIYPDYPGMFRSHTPQLELKWQATNYPSDGDYSWYAMYLEASTQNWEHMAAIAAMAKKIFKSEEGIYSFSPEMILDRLDKLKAIYIVYDPRVDKYLRVEEIMNEEWKAYRDDWEAAGATGCQTWVMARTQSEAQVLMEEHFVEKRYYDYLAKWITARMPVIWMSKLEKPDTRPARERLAVNERAYA